MADNQDEVEQPTGADVHCERCPWTGTDTECWTPDRGCVCPDCGSMWTVTEGAKPKAFTPVREQPWLRDLCEQGG